MSKRHFKRKYYWFLRMYGWSRRNQCIDSLIRIVLKNGFLFYFGWVRRYLFLTLFMWETNLSSHPSEAVSAFRIVRLRVLIILSYVFFFLCIIIITYSSRYILALSRVRESSSFVPALFYQAPWRIPPPVRNQAKTRWVLGGTRKKWYRRIAWVSARRIEPSEQKKHDEIA